MVRCVLRGALSISLLVTGATVTLAQSSAMSRSKPAAKAEVAQGIPLPPSPPGLRGVSVAIRLPSPDLLERQSEPDCEIPPSDRLLGAIPETTRLIYERQCYKNAESVVRSELRLLQDAIASTVKVLNYADVRRTEEQSAPGAPAPAEDVAEGDKPKSPSPDAAVSELAHHGKTRGEQTPNMSAQSKPVLASTKAVACQTSRPAGPGPRAWRVIDGRKCWYEGAVGMDKLLLHWPSPKTAISWGPLGLFPSPSAASPNSGRSDR
jgi:hypothetical protein